MVAGGIDENTTFIPGTALDTDVFVDVTQGFQLSVADHDGWRQKQKGGGSGNSALKYLTLT